MIICVDIKWNESDISVELDMVSFAKIPDIVGHLVLNECGAVLESDGDLKNDENCANIISSIVNLTDRYGKSI